MCDTLYQLLCYVFLGCIFFKILSFSNQYNMPKMQLSLAFFIAKVKQRSETLSHLLEVKSRSVNELDSDPFMFNFRVWAPSVRTPCLLEKII